MELPRIVYDILIVIAVLINTISVYNVYQSRKARRKWESRVKEAEALARSIAALVEDAKREAGGIADGSIRFLVEIGPDDWKIIEKHRVMDRVSRLN